jgi:glyoxylase-like metal-dependent hydrolase (beta-lactamase superfamily II)
MKEIIPGICQLQLQPGPDQDYVNSYLVRGEAGYLLVDTGWGTDQAWDSFLSQLAEIKIEVRDISSILITHAHPDHLGLSGRLQKLSKAKVAMHRLESATIAPRYDMTHFIPGIEKWFRINGVPENEITTFSNSFLGFMVVSDPAEINVMLNGGEMISVGLFSFKVLWTPGHTPGHICLYEPNKKLLISGDHIMMPAASGSINLYPDYDADVLDQYLNSLHDLGKLDIDLVLPGHGDPFNGIQEWVEERVRYHQRKNSAIMENLATGAKTAYQLAVEMAFPIMRREVGWKNLGDFNKRRSVLETLAHLESLHVKEKVSKSDRDSIIYYHR